MFQSLGALGSNIRTQLNRALNSDAQREAHLEAAAAAERAAHAARNRARRAALAEFGERTLRRLRIIHKYVRRWLNSDAQRGAHLEVAAHNTYIYTYIHT